MDKAQLITELCAQLQRNINYQNKAEAKEEVKVEFTLEIKPSNYFLAQMHFGTSATIPDKIDTAYFAEIWIDSKCIFRESYYLREGNEEEIKQKICDILLVNVFCYGVMSAEKALKLIK